MQNAKCKMQNCGVRDADVKALFGSGHELLDGEQREIIQRGDLACDAVVAPEVGAVGERLVVNLKNNIVYIHR